MDLYKSASYIFTTNMVLVQQYFKQYSIYRKTIKWHEGLMVLKFYYQIRYR